MLVNEELDDCFTKEGLRLGSVKQSKEIISIFRKSEDGKKWFAHMREPMLIRKMESGQLVWHKGVVLTFIRYKVKTKMGDDRKGNAVHAVKGDYCLQQILNTRKGEPKGRATEIAKAFLKGKETVWITVRKDNKVAQKFFKSLGMTVVGSKSWSNGTVPGIVGVIRCQS